VELGGVRWSWVSPSQYSVFSREMGLKWGPKKIESYGKRLKTTDYRRASAENRSRGALERQERWSVGACRVSKVQSPRFKVRLLSTVTNSPSGLSASPAGDGTVEACQACQANVCRGFVRFFKAYRYALARLETCRAASLTTH